MRLEDTPTIIRRKRLLADLDLPFEPLTEEQSAVVDAVCDLLPLEDTPQILDLLDPANRRLVCDLLRALPRTHVINRYLEQR